MKLLQEIKNFAEKELHLSVKNNFNKIYVPFKDTIQLKVINACEPLLFKEYEWQYPLIGTAPYKGFFDKELMKEEIQFLKKQNLDIDIGNVEAWSTLGIIENPLMFTVLENSDESFVETIIHELLHATIFIKSDASFNETFAEFVGEEGAKLYFESKHTPISNQLKLQKLKMKKIEKLFHDYALKLQKLYQTDMDVALKSNLKLKLLHECCEKLFALKVYTIAQTKRLCMRIVRSKNAFFSAYLTYHSAQYDFKNELEKKYQNNLKAMILDYKKSHSIE